MGDDHPPHGRPDSQRRGAGRRQDARGCAACRSPDRGCAYRFGVGSGAITTCTGDGRRETAATGPRPHASVTWPACRAPDHHSPAGPRSRQPGATAPDPGARRRAGTASSAWTPGTGRPSPGGYTGASCPAPAHSPDSAARGSPQHRACSPARWPEAYAEREATTTSPALARAHACAAAAWGATGTGDASATAARRCRSPA